MLSVTYRDHREGPGGPPGGATGPRGLRGPSVGVDQPQVVWCAPPPPGPKAPRVENPRGRGRLHLAWGASLPSWPPPLPSRWDLEGAGPLSPSPIYSGGFGAAIDDENISLLAHPTPLPPRLSQCLAKPCWSATLLHHHHAVVLLLDGVFPNLSLSPCWIKAWETSSGCMCVERGGTVVRCLDRIRPRSESLRVRLHQPRSCNASASRSSRV